MPKIVTKKYPNGDPKETKEVTGDGHTIVEELAPNQKVERRTETYSDTTSVVVITTKFDPPGTPTSTTTERTSLASGDITTEVADGAGNKQTKTEKKVRDLTPPKKGTRTTATDYVWDPVGKKYRKTKETTVTQEEKNGKKLPEESTETEYDESGKPKKRTDVKLDKDGKGNVTGRTTTTTDYEDGKAKSDGGKKETYDPDSNTFKTMSLSWRVYFPEAGQRVPRGGRPAEQSTRSKGRRPSG